MSLSLALSSLHHRLAAYIRSISRAAWWSAVLVVVAAVAAFAPELAFAWASHQCGIQGYVKVPLDLPGKSVCLPSNVVKRASFDPFMPLIFAPIVVACSALLISSFGFSYHQ